MQDPLAYFKDLPDFPGKRQPKNRLKEKVTKELAIDRFNGATSKKYIINGQERQMFTLGEVAKALGKSASTLRVWEHRGWLPKASYRTPPPKGEQIPGKTSRGRRLYTLVQVEFLLEAMEQFNIYEINHGDWDGFRKHIRNNWPK